MSIFNSNLKTATEQNAALSEKVDALVAQMEKVKAEADQNVTALTNKISELSQELETNKAELTAKEQELEKTKQEFDSSKQELENSIDAKASQKALAVMQSIGLPHGGVDATPPAKEELTIKQQFGKIKDPLKRHQFFKENRKELIDFKSA